MILFRIVCFLQMIITVFLAFKSVIYLFATGYFYFFLQSFFFLLMASLAILGLSLMGSNYPDRPVIGKQKAVFNWLFLLNFLLIAFLFGLVFSEYNRLAVIGHVLNKPVFSLPFRLLIDWLTNVTILLFQFSILYGLYTLRRQLYINSYNKQFEFEKESRS